MKILITAGPTREYIDDVRFLSNASTGRMGCAIARAAVGRGHEVVLVCGPLEVAPPPCCVRDVVSTADMLERCCEEFPQADALIMASRQKPNVIIEFSTLTGAIITALGDGMAGLMCRNKKLKNDLLQAANACGELLWELPLFSEYRKDITAKIADLKNADYRGASSIKAGLFLQEFVGKTPFAHLDIAGTAFLSKPGFWLNTEGATGFGVRLLVQFLQDLAKLSNK